VVNVAEAVGQALAGLGARDVFGLLGSGNFVVTNALVEHGARFIAARHEGGAITMADAYARVSGRVGVCTVHQGPGLTNAMTGLTEAAKSRTPLVLLAADTAASAIRSNFRIEQDNLVRAVGAIPERLHDPVSAPADATRAWRRAEVERRPVVLMLPLDVQAAPLPESVRPWIGHQPEYQWTANQPPHLPLTRPSEQAIIGATNLLALAHRPLIIAGRGAVLAAAREPLEQLADYLGALLATSANGNGLFTGNPWSLGISGGFASPAALELIPQADVVLCVGAGLNMWTTRHGQLVNPRTAVIQVDHEADVIGAHHRVDVAVVGDAAEGARALVESIRRRNSRDQRPAPRWRTPDVANRIRTGTWKATPFDDASTEIQIDPRTLSIALDDLLPDERTLAVDSGHFMGYPPMYLRVPDAQGFVFTQAFQAVGLGLASAIGAAIALPDRLTVAALGDGGAMLALPEIETVARLGLRMLIVVYNDAAYGAEVHHFRPQGHPVDLVQFPDVDFAALGRAAGLDGATIRRRDDLDRPIIGWLEGEGKPGLLLDAKVVPTVVAEWLEEAFRGH
jgi:thiamine pyrophosphate-dependent acetolactate synthase large subunit-like protein